MLNKSLNSKQLKQIYLRKSKANIWLSNFKNCLKHFSFIVYTLNLCNLQDKSLDISCVLSRDGYNVMENLGVCGHSHLYLVTVMETLDIY